jgi:hypothetical protein
VGALEQLTLHAVVVTVEQQQTPPIAASSMT